MRGSCKVIKAYPKISLAGDSNQGRQFLKGTVA